MIPPGVHRHKASRHIKALPQAIYDAFLSREAVSCWLPPDGATMDIDVFEAHIGGQFRMTLTFDSTAGKSLENADIVEGRFVDLVPGKRIVQSFEFISDDPAFAGTMTMSWSLDAISDGTNVTIVAHDVPRGINRTDHEVGIQIQHWLTWPRSSNWTRGATNSQAADLTDLEPHWNPAPGSRPAEVLLRY